MNYYLGLDIGTSNVKAVLFDEHFNYIFSSERSISTLHPEPEFAEQDVNLIYEKATELLTEIISYCSDKKIKVNAIGVSAAMHSFLPLDQSFKPLSNALIWSDLRSKKHAKAFKENFQFEINVPWHPMLPVFKWKWWSEYRSTEDVYKIVSVKDYIIYKWTGKCVTDTSTASATGFYDIFEDSWHQEVLNAVNLPEKLLPELKPTTFQIDSWNEEIISRIGIKLPPIVIGATDGCLANLAAGVKDESMASLTIGTSAAIRTAVSNAEIENNLFSYPITNDYIVKGGALNNGGNVVEWLRKAFFRGEDFWTELEDVLKSISPGSDGLIFLPFLHGERTPFWDPDLTGAYLGISHIHSREHFVKATLEGVTFALKHVMSILDKEDDIDAVIVDGGFTKSKAWVQLVSDVLGKKLLLPSHSFGAALGAAMLAKMKDTNTGIKETLDEIEVTYSTIHPDKEKSATYTKLFSHYLDSLQFH